MHLNCDEFIYCQSMLNMSNSRTQPKSQPVAPGRNPLRIAVASKTRCRCRVPHQFHPGISRSPSPKSVASHQAGAFQPGSAPTCHTLGQRCLFKSLIPGRGVLTIFNGYIMRMNICKQDTGYQNPLCREKSVEPSADLGDFTTQNQNDHSAVLFRNRNPQRTRCCVGCRRPVTKLHGVQDLRLGRSRRNNQIRTPITKPQRTVKATPPMCSRFVGMLRSKTLLVNTNQDNSLIRRLSKRGCRPASRAAQQWLLCKRPSAGKYWFRRCVCRPKLFASRWSQ